MSLRDDLSLQLKTAMKSGDDVKKQTLRLLLSAVKLADIENSTPVDDEKIISLVQKEIKVRQETIDSAKLENREEMIERATLEMEELKKLLPKQLDESEIIKLINEAINECGASTVKDMGNVMKLVLPKIQGRAPNSVVSQLVKSKLS